MIAMDLFTSFGGGDYDILMSYSVAAYLIYSISFGKIDSEICVYYAPTKSALTSCEQKLSL